MTGIARDTVVDGRYRVVNRIGSGGMADVWCADDTQLGRKVALKLLHARFAEDDEFVERFRREASSAAGLQHPNVVSVFDRGEWDGTYYIAMEYLPGRSLKQLVRDHGPLDPALAVSLVVQILKAARFAHRRGIVHRDIKPHNVIVDDEGRAKVTDFGIARAGASDMTETGSIMGTAQYLSPEQAQGHPVDARADLYSIGVVLYELLTGHVPFDGESPVTIALKHVSEDPVPPGQLNPDVPPALDAVVMRAMAKDPAQRFQDADAFIAALQHAMAADGQGTAPVGDPVARAAGRRPALVAVGRGDEHDPPRARGGGRRRVAAAAAGAAHGPRRRRPARRHAAQQPPRRAASRCGSSPSSPPRCERDRVVSPGPGRRGGGGRGLDGDDQPCPAGPARRPVPGVVGLPRDGRRPVARGRLRGRSPARVLRRRRARRVIETSPPEGSVVERGTQVTLVVSRGAEQVAVPNVVGLLAGGGRAGADRRPGSSRA